MSWRTLVSRSGVPTPPRKYFWATTLIASCDQERGTSTSFCSKMTWPFSPVIAAVRRSHSTRSNAWLPGGVKTRPKRRPLTALPCPLDPFVFFDAPCARPARAPVRSATFLAISLEKASFKHPREGVFKRWVSGTLAGSMYLFVWEWKRPKRSPATYAPGPRSNVVHVKSPFWACQALNTRYSVSRRLYLPHVGGLTVDNSERCLGKGCAIAVGRCAKPSY